MDLRIGVGIAGGLGLVAAGAWMLSRPGGAELPEPGSTPVDDIVERYFTAYDKDGNGSLAVGAKPYDIAVQEPGNSTVVEVTAWAQSDERVHTFEGDIDGNGYTLPVLTDLPFLMHVVQAHSPVGQAEIGSLEVTRPMLREAISSMYDADLDDALSGVELAKLGADYPAQKINFRWIRVINEGEWRAPDHDHPIVDVPDVVAAPADMRHDHSAHTTGDPAHDHVVASPTGR